MAKEWLRPGDHAEKHRLPIAIYEPHRHQRPRLSVLFECHQPLRVSGHAQDEPDEFHGDPLAPAEQVVGALDFGGDLREPSRRHGIAIPPTGGRAFDGPHAGLDEGHIAAV